MTDVSISLQDKLACVQRELRIRTDVYPHGVQTGKMTQAWAEFQLACMAAIVADYARQVESQGESQETNPVSQEASHD